MKEKLSKWKPGQYTSFVSPYSFGKFFWFNDCTKEESNGSSELAAAVLLLVVDW